MLSSRYITGEGAAVIRPTAIALVAPGISDEAASVLWQRAQGPISGGTVQSVLEHFGHTDLDFVSVAIAERQLELVVRGSARIELQDSSGQVEVISSLPGQTHRDCRDDILRVTAILGDEPARLGEGWQVESGLVGAGQVTAIVTLPQAVVEEAAQLDVAALDTTVLAESIRAARAGTDQDIQYTTPDVDSVALTNAADLALGDLGQDSSVRSVVLATGLVVPLDRPVLMGRSPIASRAVGDVAPRLVTFESVQRDISRTHVQVWQADDQVFVIDLDSTNGVYAAEPGQQLGRIQAGVPHGLPVGSVVEIGDGATFVIR